ncbi:MAG: MetQ/NlpA family ABC transporter substrate-binding protein [Lachnospiraceae bacterium]|nr:MetQ/NlpA family ABC transporter substrate-binding protein [Lachnospiraceae bacterium]
MKKVLSLILTAALMAGVLTACGSKEKTADSAETAQTEAETADTAAAETDTDAETQTGELQVITVAATAVPHAEILEAAKPILAAKGYDLQVTVFDDYVQPNNVVESGEIDANYFQHIPYLESFNEEQGTHLVNAGGIHYEPFGIYAGTESDLTNVPEGATIAIPNDTTNEARALLLLQDNGLLTLNADAGINATILDIEENPYNIEFVELEAAQVSKVLSEVSFAVINGNYALDAGLNAQTDALATETSDSLAAQTYVNVIAVKEGNENNDAVKALVETLKSDEIKKFIEETYEGAVVPFE